MDEMETKIRDWYMERYPLDELGKEINPELTFQGLFDALDQYKDVYEVLGVGDSIVRESCFDQLANIMGTGYKYVYDQWIRGSEVRNGG